MKVKIKKDQEEDLDKDLNATDEEEDLITNQDDQEEDNSPKKSERDLELENAKLQGKVEALSQKSKQNSAQSEVDKQEQLKAQVINHIDTLSDEDFEKSYNMSKVKAYKAISDHDRQLTETRSAESNARLEAKTDLVDKYGKSFQKYKYQIEDAIQDASPEVRKDPKRLYRFMEREFLALSSSDRDKNRPKNNDKDDKMNKRIVRDFSPPTPKDDISSRKSEEDEDDFKSESDRELAGKFGFETHKQLKEARGNYIDIDVGAGMKFTHDGHGGVKIVKQPAPTQ